MKSYGISRKMKKDNHKLGIILMILTALFFALIAFIIKLLDNVPLMEVVLFRNLPSMIIIQIIIIKQKNINIWQE